MLETYQRDILYAPRVNRPGEAWPCDKDYEIIRIVVGITRMRKRSDKHKDDKLTLNPTTYIVWQN